MKQTKIITLIFTISSLTNVTFGQTTQHCICGDNYEKILTYKDNSNQLLLCGTKSDSDSLIYELTVYDCVRQTFLLDNRYDEIFPNYIKLTNKGFIITDYHFAPIGENWEQSIFPFLETEYSFDSTGKPKEKEKIIFDYPDLTLKQINDIKELCDRLHSQKSLNKKHYPFDYETIYILFVGAYKDIYTARQLFFDLKNLFEFDGAAAETLSEIDIERLIGK